MSKMSQLHAELTEQAYDLGFESIEDAENNGYEVIYDGENFARLVRSEDEQELAHEDWLRERKEVLEGLENVLKHTHDQPLTDYEILCVINYNTKAIEHAIEFIKKGEI